ncbi:MAG: hypothetical protein ABI559_11005 [Chloroflexota bacterium]
MCDVNAEAKVYIRQGDGQLKPVDMPDWLAQREAIYFRLRKKGLVLDEIRFLFEAKAT